MRSLSRFSVFPHHHDVVLDFVNHEIAGQRIGKFFDSPPFNINPSLHFASPAGGNNHSIQGVTSHTTVAVTVLRHASLKKAWQPVRG